MIGGAIANLFVRLTADTSPLSRGFDHLGREVDKVENKVTRAGDRMASTGRKMTMGITVPLVAIGAAGIKAASDLETTFAQIEGLAEATSAEIAVMRDHVMSLSGETGRGPQELADGMMFIASSGLAGQVALDALTVSAKAAAAGMGETEIIADLVTSAINAYGAEALSAAQVTDDLTAAVRLGKAEPDEMANAMSRVLPVASAMGVEFHEIAAAFAAMSLSGNSAEESATQIRGILATILSPSKQASDALASVGLSAEGLQKSLADDGLLATLQLLVARMGDNVQATEAVFGNVRALTGVMNMLGANVESTEGIFESMTDTTGSLDEAFAAVAGTSGFAMDQAWASLQTSLIAIGEHLLPLVIKAADALSALLDVFASAPAPIQTAAIAVGAVAAAMGPLIWLTGTLTAAWGKMAATALGKRIAEMAGGMRGLATAMGGATAVAGAAIGVWMMWDHVMGKARDTARDFFSGSDGVLTRLTKGLKDGSVTMGDATAKIAAMRDEVARLNNEADSSRAPWDADKRAALRAAADEVDNYADNLEALTQIAKEVALATGSQEDAVLSWLVTQQEAGVTYTDLEAAVEAYRIELLKAEGVTPELAEEIANMGQEATDAEVAVKQMEEALKEWERTVRGQFDPIFGFTDGLVSVEDAQRAVTEAQHDLNEAYRQGDQAGVVKAQRDLDDAYRDSVGAALDLDIASRRLEEGLRHGQVSIEDATAAIDSWEESGRISAATADHWRQKIASLHDKLVETGGYKGTAHIGVHADTAQAETGLLGVINRLRELARLKIEVAGHIEGKAQAIMDRADAWNARRANLTAAEARAAMGSIPGRWAGGPVIPGRLYITDEPYHGGPGELFAPSSAGRILSAAQAEGVRRAATAEPRSERPIEVINKVYLDGRQIAETSNRAARSRAGREGDW